jgi:hypothetical protein
VATQRGAQVPADTIIDRDVDYRASLLERLRKQLGIGVRREGIHVSDLVNCTRKSWAEGIFEFTPKVSDATILTWLRGLSHEDLIAEGVTQVRSGYCFECQKNTPNGSIIWELDDAWCPLCGARLVVGTIDWIIDDASPVECKSTMKSSRKHMDDGEMAWYVDQVKSYMAMHGKDYGRVVVLHNMGDYSRGDRDIRSDGPQPELIVYRVQWRDPNAAKNWLATMRLRKDRIEDVETKPPLDEHSPAHPYICDYCIVGEKLPDGTECERWPWEMSESGQYVKKGSGKGRVVQLDDMLAELEKMSDTKLTEGLEASLEETS